MTLLEMILKKPWNLFEKSSKAWSGSFVLSFPDFGHCDMYYTKSGGVCLAGRAKCVTPCHVVLKIRRKTLQLRHTSPAGPYLSIVQWNHPNQMYSYFQWFSLIMLWTLAECRCFVYLHGWLSLGDRGRDSAHRHCTRGQICILKSGEDVRQQSEGLSVCVSIYDANAGDVEQFFRVVLPVYVLPSQEPL